MSKNGMEKTTHCFEIDEFIYWIIAITVIKLDVKH